MKIHKIMYIPGWPEKDKDVVFPFVSVEEYNYYLKEENPKITEIRVWLDEHTYLTNYDAYWNQKYKPTKEEERKFHLYYKGWKLKNRES